MDLTIGLAFIAGLVSFISPCVLPLVPAYIGYMGGRVTQTVAARTTVAAGAGGSTVISTPLVSRFSTLLHGVFFVAGFTFVFVTIGLLSTAFVRQIGGQNIQIVTDIIGRVGGIVIIFFGLHFMGVMPSIFNRLLSQPALLNNVFASVAVALVGAALILWGFVVWQIGLIVLAVFGLWLVLGGAFTQPGNFWTRTINTIQQALYTDTRRQMVASGQQGLANSAIMGVVFSAGWTPCIGPVYGAVLTLAANGGDIGQAGVMLTAYSLGLGIPFLLTALLLDSAQVGLRRLQRHMHKIELFSGAFLVLIGVLIATGSLQRISQQFAADFADFSVRVEECTVDAFTGQMPWGSIGPCLNGTLESAPEASGAVPSETVEQPALPSISGLAETVPDVADVGTAVGSQAPNFETVTDSGETLQLAEQRGKVVLVNFWATWCGPCRVEMPAFEQAFTEFSDDGLVILAINNRETVEEIAGFRAEMAETAGELTFPIALDPRGQINQLYGVAQYPSTYIIDQQGIIVERHFGAMNADQIRESIESLLNDGAQT